MDTTVSKAQLLDILRANRAKHQEVFEEAVRGWHDHALKMLAGKEKEIRSGRLPRAITISLPAPENHVRDYNRVIRMLEMHLEDQYTLTEQEFSWYVEDNWDWKRRWTVSNSGYAAGKFAEVYGTDYMEELA